MKIRILLFVIFNIGSTLSFAQLLHFNTNHNENLSVNDTSSYSEKIKDVNQEYWLGVFPKYNIRIQSYINTCNLDSIDSKGVFRKFYLNNRLIYSDSIRGSQYCTTFFELLDNRYIFCTAYANQNFNTCMSIERETCFIIDINQPNFIYQVDFERKRLAFREFTWEEYQKTKYLKGLYSITELNLQELYLELFSDLGKREKIDLKKNINPFFL
jgi:hypothetical protein